MKKIWGRAEYTTTVAGDDEDGWTAVELFRDSAGKVERVARVVYWDAEGQFVLEFLVPELPLLIVELLASEAKEVIKLR